MSNYLFFSSLLTLFCTLFSVQASDLPSVCPDIISKTRWGARTAVEVDYALVPVGYVIVHHTVTPSCNTEKSCSEQLRNIQNFHMEVMEFQDIGYNFIVGGDGKIYEGAGWHKVGAHTRKYNTRSLGLGFIGNFSDELPNEDTLKAAKDFLECGVQLGELANDYKLLGGRQVSPTVSPGLRLYRELKNWKHWTSKP